MPIRRGFYALLVALIGVTAWLVVPVGASVSPTEPGMFGSVPPFRVLDTRTTSSPLTGGSTLTQRIAITGGPVPQDAGAALLNVTATGATGSGSLTVFAGRTALPGTSSLNFAAGATVQNLVLTGLSQGGDVNIHAETAGVVHVIVDVLGWFPPGAPAEPGAVGTVNPVRVLDTRTRLGRPGPVDGSQPVPLTAAGVGGVPADAAAVVLNLTVTQPTTAGFVTAYPIGADRPETSNVNFVAGQTTAKLVVVPIGVRGQVWLQPTLRGTVHLVADVLGYVTGGDAIEPGSFGALPARRLLDTRSAPGTPVRAGQPVTVQLTGPDSVPPGADSAVLNVTVTQPTGSGHLTVFPAGSTPPGTSNLNYATGQTVPSLVVVPIGADGLASIQATGTGTVHVVVDVVGYFHGPRPPVMRWRPPEQVGFFGLMSCVGANFCAVAGSGAFATFDGTSWTRRADAERVTAQVSCPTVAFCAVGSDSGDIRVWNGSAMSEPVHVLDGRVDQLACPSTRFCMAADARTYSVFDGSAWSAPQSRPSSTFAISCPAEGVCIGAAGSWRRFSNGAWGPAAPLPATVNRLSCATVDFCGALTANSGYMIFDGAGWRAPVVGPMPVNLSCPRAGFCVGVLNNRAVEMNRAQVGRFVEIGLPESGLAMISCGIPTRCVVIASNGQAVVGDAAG